MNNPKMPPCFSGFEHIHRYWDASRQVFMAKIQPGEFYVTNQDEAITTVLGSCVSACIRDSQLGVGGMNHFMLPLKGSVYDDENIVSYASRYGNWAMEYLINQILKNGGRRRHLEVKIFGGGRVIDTSAEESIGEQNVKFILEYLYNENLPIKSKDVLGLYPRLIIFYPKDGKVQVKQLTENRKAIVAEEKQYMETIDNKNDNKQNDVELF